MAETTRSRFLKTLRGETPEDRLPLFEYAPWWDLTLRRWESEGLPTGLSNAEIKRFFGLDVDYPHWFAEIKPGAEKQGKNDRWICNEDDYERLLPSLFPDPLPTSKADMDEWRKRADEQERGEAIIWIMVSGFFWWPRVLLGIEPHLFAFYDQPKLMHRINRDMAQRQIQNIETFCSEVCVPDFLNFAEDMSYNHGPMISKELFDEFMAPYYRIVVPKVVEYGIIPSVDSDGDVEPLIPWFEELGIRAMSPLECRAGVDVSRIRANHPDFNLIGGFDKTVMCKGETAMRPEFERILPTMRGGHYVPSVDHQTPPDVSLENYRVYVRLLKEYAKRAVK